MKNTMNVKKTLRFSANEFIYGGHLLSLGAAGIVFTSAILLNIKITWDFLVIAYLIIYAAYSYNRFAELSRDYATNPSRTEHAKKYINLLPFAILFSILVIVLLIINFGKFYSLYFCVFLILGSLLYTEYFKSFTKKVVGFKSFYVSLFWALLVPLLASYYGFFLGLPIFVIFSFVFLRLMVNTVFFDIKDIDSDKTYNLKTVPIFLGKEKTFFFLYTINLLSFIPLIYGVYKNVLPVFSLSLIVFCFYTIIYLRSATNNMANIQKLSYVMVDGEYILWAVVVLLVLFV